MIVLFADSTKATREPAFHLLRETSCLFSRNSQPSSGFRTPTTMMFQASDCERTRESLRVRNERLASTEMSHARAANGFREMPAGAATVLHYLLFPVMTADMLQVGHSNPAFSAL